MKNNSSVAHRDDIVSSLIHSSMFSACLRCLATVKLDVNERLLVSYHGTCLRWHMISRVLHVFYSSVFFVSHKNWPKNKRKQVGKQVS